MDGMLCLRRSYAHAGGYLLYLVHFPYAWKFPGLRKSTKGAGTYEQLKAREALVLLRFCSLGT